MSKKKFWVLSIVFFVITGSVFFIYKGMENCSRLKCFNMLSVEQFKLKDVYEEGENSYRALYKNNEDLLRVEIHSGVSAQEAQKYINTQIARVKGLYEDAPAPYPGEITDEISCSNEFKPSYTTIKQNNLEVSYIKGFLNERLVAGSCTKDQAVYINTMSLFYCSSHKQFYQLEIIIPVGDYKKNEKKYLENLRSITCR